jgi:hypothetical protein
MKPKQFKAKIDCNVVEVNIDGEIGAIVLYIAEDHNNDWSPKVLSMTPKQANSLAAAIGNAVDALQFAKVKSLIKAPTKSSGPTKAGAALPIVKRAKSDYLGKSGKKDMVVVQKAGWREPRMTFRNARTGETTAPPLPKEKKR